MFDYPGAEHSRKHGPIGYAQPEYFKPWIRDEFMFRCVYCLEREMWHPHRNSSFGVEHVTAKSDDPAVAKTYANLAYSCNRCNSFKGTVPLLDPTAAAFGEHLAVGDDGRIIGLTVEGRILVKQLHLGEFPAIQNRQDAIELNQLYREMPGNSLVNAMYKRHFGFPEELPNLANMRPPGGNSIEGSEKLSYYQMREDGKLPEIY